MAECEARRILVTGSRGFTGLHVVRELELRGHDIFALERPPAAGHGAGGGARVHWIGLDLNDHATLWDAVREIRPELAIHLAWYTEPVKYWTAPENLQCVAATLDLAQALAAAGCRKLVAAGTCAEYDWSGGVMSETRTPLRPRTLYGACKNAAREVLEAYCHRVSMQFAWLRFFCLYGPGEAPQRLVPSVILSLLRGETAQCTSGEQARDFLYVSDAAAAVAALALSNGTGPFNIASGHAVKVRTMVETIARLLGPRSRIDFGAIPANPFEPQYLAADIQKVTAALGWRASAALEYGLAQSVDWWKRNAELASGKTL